MSVFDKREVPWDSGGEVLIWLGALVVATFFIHNVVRKYKEH